MCSIMPTPPPHTAASLQQPPPRNGEILPNSLFPYFALSFGVGVFLNAMNKGNVLRKSDRWGFTCEAKKVVLNFAISKMIGKPGQQYGLIKMKSQKSELSYIN